MTAPVPPSTQSHVHGSLRLLSSSPEGALRLRPPRNPTMSGGARPASTSNTRAAPHSQFGPEACWLLWLVRGGDASVPGVGVARRRHTDHVLSGLL